jgi:hypothetical protein
MLYANRLAKEAYLALIFDQPYYDESEGKPRRLERRKVKVEGVKASIDLLLTRKKVNMGKLYALGI